VSSRRTAGTAGTRPVICDRRRCIIRPGTHAATRYCHCTFERRPAIAKQLSNGQLAFTNSNTVSHSRDAMRPRDADPFRPEITEGAGKAGCRLHPWVPCNKKHGGRTTGSTGITPAFPAQWFTAYFVLPGDRAFLPPSSADCSANLTPASGCQDHTASPYATRSVRLPLHSRPPHPLPRS
jgi:hypothetical protein